MTFEERIKRTLAEYVWQISQLQHTVDELSASHAAYVAKYGKLEEETPQQES